MMPTKEQSFSAKPEPSFSHGAEVDQFHTRLLRISLAIEESRAYWNYFNPEIPNNKLALVAFESRWFGSKSLQRVKLILAAFHHRYNAYRDLLKLLSHWRPTDPVTRQNIVHWHAQLSDPMYRAFSGTFLEQRRIQPNSNIERDIAARWVTQQLPTEWATATTQRMATALISCASAAGLCEDKSGDRRLMYPKVTDEALGYWLHVLRHLNFQGTLLENPYLGSVGLREGFLEQRLTKLSGISFNRMGDLHEFNWQYPDLKGWAKGELGLSWEGVL